MSGDPGGHDAGSHDGARKGAGLHGSGVWTPGSPGHIGGGFGSGPSPSSGPGPGQAHSQTPGQAPGPGPTRPPHLPPEPPPDDPLARRSLPVAGVHTGRVIAAGAGLIALGGIAWLLTAGEPAPEPPRRALDVTRQSPAPALPRYEDLSVPAVATPPVPPTPVEPPRPRFDPATPIGPSPTQAAPASPDRLAEQARAAGVGGWSRPREEGEGRPPGDPAGSDGLYPRAMAGADSAAGMTADTARGAGHWGQSQTAAAPSGTGACHVPAGTPIPLQTLNRVVTEQGGMLVAMVTRDVLGNGLTCRAIPAGSTVTLSVAPGSARGQRRIAVADPVITRPWPWADSIRPAAVAADTTGAAGLPGRVQVPWLSTGLLIAAGTATDLATAALSDGGSLIGPILGRTADRPLDQATRALLDRLPVITLEPGAGMTLLLAGPLTIPPG